MVELPDSVVTGLLALFAALGCYGAYLTANTWLAEKIEHKRQREAARRKEVDRG